MGMDPERYLARVGLTARPEMSPEGLALVQTAHRLSIGFENLDVMLGRPILIDSRAVFDKLVTRGRGGYCFEQNRLFADMLVALGFSLRPLLARVMLGAAEADVTPRTHTLLLVDLGGGPWLADAGFGGSFLPPLPLVDGAQAQTAEGASHRLVQTGERGSLDGEWLLERAGPSAATDGRAADHLDWQPQYRFDLAEVAPIDLEMSNHWTSTRPGTRFTTLHVASIALPDGFASLTDRQLTVHRAGHSVRREIADMHEYAATLRETFRIALADEDAARLALFT